MKTLFKHALRRAGYDLRSTRFELDALKTKPRAVTFDDLVCRLMFEQGRELSFVQVGAFDGQTHDPLCRYITSCGWRGVLVEPQPREAASLEKLHQGNERISIVRAVVSDTEGSRTL